MKWILIALNLSNWDGSVASKIEIGEFVAQNDCMAERVRLEQREGDGSVQFLCVNQPSVQPTEDTK